jgi:hypothetical protein
MNIDLTPENAAALTQYAALSWQRPTEFLNEYLSGTMIPLFDNPRISHPSSR